jgi:carbon storage regulator
MLVLSRKVGERLLIGDNIAITIVRIQGGGVRIGVEAPTHLAVVREELKAKLDQERQASIGDAPSSPKIA